MRTEPSSLVRSWKAMEPSLDAAVGLACKGPLIERKLLDRRWSFHQLRHFFLQRARATRSEHRGRQTPRRTRRHQDDDALRARSRRRATRDDEQARRLTTRHRRSAPSRTFESSSRSSRTERLPLDARCLPRLLARNCRHDAPAIPTDLSPAPLPTARHVATSREQRRFSRHLVDSSGVQTRVQNRSFPARKPQLCAHTSWAS